MEIGSDMVGQKKRRGYDRPVEDDHGPADCGVFFLQHFTFSRIPLAGSPPAAIVRRATAVGLVDKRPRGIGTAFPFPARAVGLILAFA